MTIEEIREKYSHRSDGYIDCKDCPVPYICCKGFDMNGFSDCWDEIQDYLNNLENRPQTNQFDTDMVKALSGILCDINPTEIASQIANDNLSKWCETIRAEILKEVQK